MKNIFEKKLKEEYLSFLLAICVLLYCGNGIIKYILPISAVYSFLSDVVVDVFVVYAVLFYIFVKKRIQIKLDLCLLLFVLAWLFLSCLFMSLSQKKNWFAINYDPIFDSIKSFLIIYIFGKKVSVLVLKKNVKTICYIFYVIISALLLGVLIVIFTGNSLVLCPGCRFEMKAGAFWLNCNPNITGSIMLTNMLIGVWLIQFCKKRCIFIILFFCEIVHYVGVVLSNSRTSIVAASIGFGMIMIAVLKKIWGGTTAIGRFRNTLLGVVTGGIVFIGRYVIFGLYNCISGRNSLARNVYNSRQFSGRIGIWKHAIRIIGEPRILLTGVTPIGVFETLEDKTGIHSMPINAHNSYLEIGAAIGIAGMVFFFLWLVLIWAGAIKMWKYKQHDFFSVVATIEVLTLLMVGTMESFLVFYGNYIQYLFYILCGYLIYRSNIVSFFPTIDISLRFNNKGENVNEC